MSVVPYILKEPLKTLFSKGEFGEEFIEVAKKELPYLWGRLSLLEEFYALSMRGGDPDRIPQLHSQLGTPRQYHGSVFRKFWAAITG